MRANFKYILLLLLVPLLFFGPVFKGQIPFPGDLLVSYYEPYKAYPILGYQPGAVPSKNQGADVIRHIFPWKYFTVESLKKGETPFWNPHNFSGNPLMANFQSGFFYPLNIIFLVFPFLSAWTIYIMLIPILASLFMYLFLRELLLSKITSVFGGLVFAFSSYMVVWMEYGNIGHTFLWLSLALYFTERFCKKPKFRTLIFLTLTLTASLLAGYIQSYFYATIVVFVYFVWKSFVKNGIEARKLLIFSFSLIFPILFSLFQILPTLDLFSESTRSNYSISRIQHLLNPWWYTITAVIPNFFGHPASNNHWFYGTYIERVSYIGVIPFILFVYALFNFRKRIEIAIFGTIALLTFILVTDLVITKYFFKIPFPLISTTVPTRMLGLFQFSAVVLSAIGFEYLIKNFKKKTLYMSIIFVSLIVAASWIFVFTANQFIRIDPINLSIAKKNLIIPTTLVALFTISLYFNKKSRLVIWVILIITVLDLLYFFNRITPFSPKEFVYPQTPVIEYLKETGGLNRFWGYGSGYVESDFQTYDGTFSPEGVDPLHIKRYTRLLESSKDGSLSNDLPRPDANLAPGYGKTNLRENQYRQRLLNLLGVKYVLNKSGSSDPDNETFSPGTYDLKYHDGFYQAYENKESLPRFFLAGNYVVENDEQRMLDKIYDSSFDLKKILILEEEPGLSLGEDLESSLRVKSYENNNVSFLTSSKTNTLLFMSDTYFPSWKAKIDGKESKIYRAHYAFRAVPVAKGDHTVEFYYDSESSLKGLRIAFLSIILLIILVPIIKRYEKK